MRVGTRRPKALHEVHREERSQDHSWLPHAPVRVTSRQGGWKGGVCDGPRGEPLPTGNGAALLNGKIPTVGRHIELAVFGKNLAMNEERWGEQWNVGDRVRYHHPDPSRNQTVEGTIVDKSWGREGGEPIYHFTVVADGET
jgi:hypothetical protein